MVAVEPRGTGMAVFTLRAAEEVRVAQFGVAEGELDAEMVTIAKAIIAQRTGSLDPTTYRDRYQEALRPRVNQRCALRHLQLHRQSRCRAGETHPLRCCRSAGCPMLP